MEWVCVRTHRACACVGVYMRVGALSCVCAHVCGCQWPWNSRLVWSSEQQGRKPAPSTGLLSGVADYGYVCPRGPSFRCAGVWGATG